LYYNITLEKSMLLNEKNAYANMIAAGILMMIKIKQGGIS